MAKKYWLMKSEESVYSVSDLKKDKKTSWEGVRNYQARNFMRDGMQKGDSVLFYHSNSDPTGVAGVAEVFKEAYPDDSAWDKKSRYYDARSTKEKPSWMMVDIRHIETFNKVVALADLKGNKKLKDMMVVKKSVRLSVQPVSAVEFKEVLRMARK